MGHEPFIWFVHSIWQNKQGKPVAVLFKIDEGSVYSDNFGEKHPEVELQYTTPKIESALGAFIHLRGASFESANTHPFAKRSFFLNNLYRGLLLKKAGGEPKEPRAGSNVYSYHVNVGHGNSSIIVFHHGKESVVWVVDCSKYDFTNKQDYTPSLEATFGYIVSKFKIDRLHIEKLFLTHPHFDHYNGITWLLQCGHLSGTEIWINLHYSWPESRYSSLLKNLLGSNCTFIEPTISSHASKIRLLHPQRRAIRSYTPKYPRSGNYILANNPNDASACYVLGNPDKAMVFPGDLETSRWNTITDCCPCLRNITKYAISHHASSNGHVRTLCPRSVPINNISQCMTSVKSAILMGRDGAYSGIYHPSVLSAFPNRLFRTDHVTSTGRYITFIELDWQTNLASYH